MASYDDISIFLALASTGSFVGAARKTGLPTSSVSRRIAQLERSLPVQLVRRTTRRVSLTELGRAYADRCSCLYEEIDSVTQSLSNNDVGEFRGTLRVTAPVLAGVETFGPWLFEFAALHRELRLDLQITNGLLDLVGDGIDLAFRLGPIAEGSDVVRRLWGVPYILCAAPTAAATALPLEHPAGLTALRLIVTPPMTAWTFVGEANASFVLRPTGDAALAVTNLALAAEAARQGLGIACLPFGLIEADVRSGTLVTIEMAGWRLPDRHMYAVYPPGKQLSPKVRGAIDYVLKKREQHPQGMPPTSPRKMRESAPRGQTVRTFQE